MFGPQKGADPATVAVLEAQDDGLGRRVEAAAGGRSATSRVRVPPEVSARRCWRSVGTANPALPLIAEHTRRCRR